jgi:hypothetical protein
MPPKKSTKTSKSKRIAKSAQSGRSENSAPAFRPIAGVKERHWGGDGTVGVPDSVRVLLRYQTEFTPNTTLGGQFAYQFRGNSVFDPDYTGAGAQPSYFDNWANMYNSYVVLSSRIRIEVMGSTGGAGPAPALSAVYPAYNTALSTTALDAAAMRYAVSCSTSSVGGNAYKKVLNNAMSTAQQFGISEDAVVEDDLYSATVTTNPAAAQQWYWTYVAQVESGTTTLAMFCRAMLEYDVKFFDPVVVNLSATRHVKPKTPGEWERPASAGEFPQLPTESIYSGASAAAVVSGVGQSCQLPQATPIGAVELSSLTMSCPNSCCKECWQRAIVHVPSLGGPCAHRS